MKWYYLLIGIGIYSYAQRQKETVKVYYVERLPFDYNGLIVPPIGVFIKKEAANSNELLQHELVHWEQYREEGLIPFLIGYISENIRNGYDNNGYEVEARSLTETEYCMRNYTECVRKGMASTVHNPNFRKNIV
jgi:hypothetical protein